MRLTEKVCFWIISFASVGSIFILAKIKDNLSPRQLKELFYTGNVNGR